jgi:hypothetical protein
MTYILDPVLSQAIDAVLPFFPYRCDLITVPITLGTSGGMVGGKETAVGTHKLYLQADAFTSAITLDYEIHVAAYQNEPAKVFIRPIFLEGAFSHLVQLAAVLKDA